MKSFLKAIVALQLGIISRLILQKYKPTIVMVTGSVGKTSTKDALAAALSEQFHLRASEKSFNSEFGVPLTIIGSKNPWNSFHEWLRVFEDGILLLLTKNNYPKMLVLEVGADRPGDLARVLRYATPHAVVVTKLPEVPVHVEAYVSPAAVREEEFSPAYALPAGAPLIICADDPYARAMAARLSARVISYGYIADAAARLLEPVVVNEHGLPSGMAATLTLADQQVKVATPRVLGRQQLYAPAAALATAYALSVPLATATAGLARYAPPPGRAHILRGLRGSVLIDDSYNSSPAAVLEALRSLGELQGAGRRIAVLGDMLELGRYSVAEHEKVGILVRECADMLVAVGIRARAIRESAITAGMAAECARAFDTSEEAAIALTTMVEEGDVVLVKGSQSVRTERIVEQLLQDPLDAKYLARQDSEWKKR